MKMSGTLFWMVVSFRILVDNALGDNGTILLSEALKVNKTLTRLSARSVKDL